ncbi:carboxypeptidase-like regulatory domain-containing protein [Pedobacter panaciterrae]|uniref:Carboxypeptidase-like regulatory domain-containing protein n=1 Tax=Pedobacter panaciterrae TaxID=363849 RepID=A0ABU8NJA5_9SPHI|nr:carboxypeptidase-like regulatory domain-containing protein [Pedobacter panaciterrae]NQX53770.1 carboxypeptidase-like regulatory domain-containing protein [Pedobacter panaciterrae]
MRLIFAFFLIVFLHTTVNANAQGITLSLKDTELSTVFKEIRKQCNYDFLYDNSLLQGLKTVSITVKNAGIDLVLSTVFEDLPVTYIIENKIVMIIAKNKNEVLPPQSLYAISGVVKDKNGETLPGAGILLSGYQTGTVADNEGRFVIRNLKEGNYNVLVQMIGYLPANQNVTIISKSADIEIKLQENIKQLKEVVITLDPHREERLKAFKESFIGTSPNSKKCEITNPEVIQFDYDDEKHILKAIADEFIVVENKALGYRIKYLLKYFEEDEETKIVLFYGYPYFEEIKGTRSKIRAYQEKRKVAYLGSPQHFFRSLYSNSIEEDGFIINKLVKAPNKSKRPDTLTEAKINFFSDIRGKQISLKTRKDSLSYWTMMKNKPDTLEVLTRGKVLTDTLVKQKLSSLKTLNYKDALYIVFKKERETRNYADHSGYKIERPPEYSRFQISLVYQLKSSINFYENGGIYDPGSLLYEGFWGYEKVADMVPMDYILPKTKD